jgi:hypothetical protein
MWIDQRSIADLYLGLVVNLQFASFGSLVNDTAMTHWIFWVF